MENRAIPIPGEFYRHFKNKLYQIVALAKHSETGECLVIYQALYDDFGVYARPLEMFLSEVDHEKYPEVSQRYRFEKVRPAGQQMSMPLCEVAQTEIVQEADATDAQTLLFSFLDAETYEEKLNILREMKKHIDDKMAYDMAVSLDIVLKEEPLAEKIKDLENCLKTYARFECSRLR